MGSLRHVHGGLMNVSNSSHVIFAVQALFHSSPMVRFTVDDETHRKSCRSLLQCLMCSLYRVYDAISKNGLGNPASLVAKWNGICDMMPSEKKTSPLDVLSVFIDVLRQQHCNSNPQYSTTDMDLHPLSFIWKSSAELEVSCPYCGEFVTTVHIPVVRLSGNKSDFKNSIITTLMGSRLDACPHSQCKAEVAKISTKQVLLAESLVIHLERCTDKFTLPFELELVGNKLSLKSVMVQPDGKPCIFIGVCPDGRFRKFEDTKISLISPGRLFTPGFFPKSKLTLIFEGNQKMTPISSKVQDMSTHLKQKRSDKVKIVGMPDLSSLQIACEEDIDDDFSFIEGQSSFTGDMTSSENILEKKDACTQTCVLVRDVAIQAPPFGSYDLCRYNKKMKFFTGLADEDFQALYVLIGGDEAIRTLKLHYRLDTPVKLRDTKLSSEDKLYMFLLRLRRGLPLEELATIFNMSPEMIGELCYVMTRLIYLTFKEMEDDWFISAEEQRKFKPKKMRPFKNLRVLLDGASFFIQSPTNFEQQGNNFSPYKGHPVMLVTVGIACNGATIFCTRGMEGRMSDQEVVLNSGLLDKLTPGDGVMTDRGYELTAELQEKGCYFYKPPTSRADRNFTPEEEILTKAIAAARIYTEHAIAEIKDNRLLQGDIPLTLLPVLDNLVFIAAYLRNFNTCRIKDKKVVSKD